MEGPGSDECWTLEPLRGDAVRPPGRATCSCRGRDDLRAAAAESRAALSAVSGDYLKKCETASRADDACWLAATCVEDPNVECKTENDAFQASCQLVFAAFQSYTQAHPRSTFVGAFTGTYA